MKFVTATIICGVVLCSPALTTPAHAQEGGTQERRIIINGQNGTKEIQLDQIGADGATGFVMVTVGADGKMFAFAGNPEELPFGGMMGPMAMMAFANGGGIGYNGPIDPGISYIHQLIKRPDVRSDLFLDSKQRDQLDEMGNNENQANQQQFNSLKGAAQAGSASGTPPGAALNPNADGAKKLHEFVQGSSSERDRKLAAILTPKQIQRLKELDLQYRGPLAMGVKPIADKAKLTETQAPVVSDLLKQYRDMVKKAMGFEQSEKHSTGPDGERSTSISSSISGSPDEMKARLDKAHDEIENARRTLGNKALKTVSDPQRTEWQSLTGRKFQFQSVN